MALFFLSKVLDPSQQTVPANSCIISSIQKAMQWKCGYLLKIDPMPFRNSLQATFPVVILFWNMAFQSNTICSGFLSWLAKIAFHTLLVLLQQYSSSRNFCTLHTLVLFIHVYIVNLDFLGGTSIVSLPVLFFGRGIIKKIIKVNIQLQISGW